MARIGIVITCIMLFVSGPTGLTAEKGTADPASKKIWESHIRGKPQGRVLSDWAVVEGLMLCQEVGGIDNELAALATVAMHEATVEKFAIDRKELIMMAQNIKGTGLTEDQREEIKELHEEIHEAYGKRPQMLFYKGSPFKGDVVVGLEKTLEDTSGIDNMMAKLRRVHGWTATLEEGQDLPFTYYKEAIDRKIPVLLRKKEKYTVGVGYVTVKDIPHLITVDLGEVPLEKQAKIYTEEGHEYFRSLPPDHPARKDYEQRLKDKEFDGDPTINADEPLLAGVSIEKFDRSRYRAMFIHDWRETTDAWREEIIDIVGEPKEEKDEEE